MTNDRNNGNGYITKKQFQWTITTLVIVMMSVFGYTIGRLDRVVEKFNHNVSSIQTDVNEVKVDVGSIKTDLKLLREAFNQDI